MPNAADRLGNRPHDPVDQRSRRPSVYRLGRRLARASDRCPADAVLPHDGDYVVELSDSRYQGASRPVYRLVVGAVPMAEEIYPLGGRAGETVGLELRGGTLAGVKIAAATVNAPFTADLFAPRIPGAMLGLASIPIAATTPALDVESLLPLVVSRYPEIRESADPAAPPSRTVAPVVLNGRIDPPGDEDQFILAVTPGQRLRIKVQAYEHGSRSTACCGCSATAARSSAMPTTPTFRCRPRIISRSRSPCPTHRSNSRSPAARMRSRSRCATSKIAGGSAFPTGSWSNRSFRSFSSR